jgi:hypothetical protein
MASAHILFAATYYANSSAGSDSNPGTSSGSAWKTLASSIPKLKAGDTLIATGTFSEQNGTGVGYSFAVSGTAGNPITIQGQNGTIDAQTGGDGGNYIFSGNYIVIDNFSVTSTVAGGMYYGGAFELDGSYSTVKNCDFHNMSGSLSGGGDKLYCVVVHGSYNTFSNLVFRSIQDGDLFRVWGHNNLITHCIVTNCTNPNYSDGSLHADLIQFWGPEGSYSNVLECSVFANNTISGGALSSDDPVNHVGDPNMNDWVYRNNVFANNGSQALQCGANRMHFYNNVFYNWSRAIDVWAVYWQTFYFENNVFISGSGIQDSYGAPSAAVINSNTWDTSSQSASSSDMRTKFAGNVLVADPGFVNAAAGDFHLLSTSVLRAKGINLSNDPSASTTDKDGNPRPASGAWDIGPYQYVQRGSAGAPTPPPPPQSLRSVASYP